MHLFVRVTKSFSDMLRCFPEFEKVCDKLVVYEHEADEEISRTHVHFLITEVKVNRETLKNIIRKHCGDMLRSDWSFKECNDIGPTITYMSKGRLSWLYKHNFEEEYINECKSLWKDPTKKTVRLTNGKLVVQDHNEKARSKNEILNEIFAELGDGCTEVTAVLSAIRKVLIANKQVIGFYKMEDYYWTVVMHKDKVTWMERMMDRISKK